MLENVRRVSLTSALLVALSGSLMACGGSDVQPAATGDASSTPVQQEESTPAVPDMPSSDEVRKVFDAMSTYDTSAMEAALPLTEKGSLARGYLGYMLASSNAAIDGGTPLVSDVATKVKGGYKSCDQTEKSSCVTWTSITGRNGKIVNFKVGGNDLADRLTTGNGTKQKAGDLAQVEFLYAYQGVSSNALYVLVSVRSGANKVNISSSEATYRDPSGRQFKTSQAEGPTDLAPRSSATVALAFMAAKPGGVVTFPFASENFMTSREVTFKTR